MQRRTGHADARESAAAGARVKAIGELAAALSRRGWRTPAQLALEIIVPFAAIASHCALAAGPLMPDARSMAWCQALGDAASWPALAAALATPATCPGNDPGVPHEPR